MRTGDWVIHNGNRYQIVAEYDNEWVYLDNEQLVNISEVKPA